MGILDKHLVETRALSEAEFEAFAKPHLDSIFDPGPETLLDTRFVDRGWPRFVTFNDDVHFLTILDSCLSPILERTKAPGFFVTVNGYITKPNRDYRYHWFVSTADLASLSFLVGPVWFFAYSVSGNWGGYGGLDEHAIFTVSPELESDFREELPLLDYQPRLFLDYLRRFIKDFGPNQYRTDIVMSTFLHVYGKDKTRNLLKQAELLDLLS